ncbi:MAG: A/G-specific adenine glycosylase [Patescibacteria group bacterium]
MNNKNKSQLDRVLREYSVNKKRLMPWREDVRPYYVLVSEMMLQQTQVDRVIPKFQDFIAAFPDFETLAVAKFSDVLKLWDGLGYNRRAKYLHDAAKIIVDKYNGKLPRTRVELESLPGIGPGTSGAIMAYAYNQPELFIETNIRTVYIHHFFPGKQNVADSDILDLLEKTIDKQNPREWYWALMDYGTHLKKTHGNLSQQSKSYTKQSRYKGSDRELRAKILKLLLSGPRSIKGLDDLLKDPRLESIVTDLVKDRLVIQHGDLIKLSD